MYFRAVIDERWPKNIDAKIVKEWFPHDPTLLEFEILSDIIKNNVEILMVSETKLEGRRLCPSPF